MVENALGRRSRFPDFLAPILEPYELSFLKSFLNTLLITSCKAFGNHFGTHSDTKSAQDIPG